MKYLFVISIIVLSVNDMLAQEQYVRIKGIPFVTRTRIPVKEEVLDLIKENNQEKMTYFFSIDNKQKVSQLQKYLRLIVKKNDLVEVDYNIRLGFYFGKKHINEIYYLDQYQRVIFKGKAFRPDKKDVENIFSLVCIPKIIKGLGSSREDYYWRYALKCN